MSRCWIEPEGGQRDRSFPDCVNLENTRALYRVFLQGKHIENRQDCALWRARPTPFVSSTNRPCRLWCRCGRQSRPLEASRPLTRHYVLIDRAPERKKRRSRKLRKLKARNCREEEGISSVGRVEPIGDLICSSISRRKLSFPRCRCCR